MTSLQPQTKPSSFDRVRALTQQYPGAAFTRVAVDVDGILFPFLTAFSHYLGDEPFSEQDSPAWKVYPRPYARERTLAAQHYAHTYEAIVRFGLHAGAQEGMTLLHDAGLQLIIVTRREQSSAPGTARALTELGVPFQDIVAAPDLVKTSWCLENDVALIIDDHPETLTRAEARGLRGLSLRWPYNEHVARARLTDDWPALAQAVLLNVIDAAADAGVAV